MKADLGNCRKENGGHDVSRQRHAVLHGEPVATSRVSHLCQPASAETQVRMNGIDLFHLQQSTSCRNRCPLAAGALQLQTQND